MSGTRWLTAGQVARLASVTEEEVAGWVRDAKLFEIKRGGQAVYPEYAFDLEWRLVPALGFVLAIQEGRAGVFMAAWFESRSSFLGGQRPREILASDPDRVVAAAKSAIESERFAG